MFDFRYPTPLPSTKGWGPGWPDCQVNKRIAHPIFQGGVHERIKELVDILVEYLESKGYKFEGGDSWGWGCRATKGGDGDVPSFHSWGLGLDFNAQQNVFGAPKSTSRLATIDNWVVDIMADYGFFWLGPSIGDWMHFSFCGSPADADHMTQKARDNLMKDERLDQLVSGWELHRADQPKPETGTWVRRGWQWRQEATTNPKPDAHDHDVVGRTA